MLRSGYLLLAPLLLIPAATAQDFSQKCMAVAAANGKQLPNATTVITSTAFHGASAAQGNTPALPEHCGFWAR